MLRAILILSVALAVKASPAITETSLAGCTWDAMPESHKEGGEGISGINMVAECAKVCLEKDGCKSFDFDGRKTAWRGIHCWLHEEEKHQNIQIEKAKEGVTFYKLTSCEPAEPEGPNLQRTVILIRVETQPQEYIFFRGGIDFDVRPECATVDSPARDSKCSVPIKHTPQENENYASYNAWISNDQVLDWGSAEPDQGSYEQYPALGSPGLWTSNNSKNALYNPLNKLGDNYWMLDVEMDCSRTQDGWFDFKTYKFNMESYWELWEDDTYDEQSCKGHGEPPFNPTSRNHHARCGVINIYTLNPETNNFQQECKSFK